MCNLDSFFLKSLLNFFFIYSFKHAIDSHLYNAALFTVNAQGLPDSDH